MKTRLAAASLIALLATTANLPIAAEPAPDKKEAPQEKALEIPEVKAEYETYTKSLETVVSTYTKALDSEEEKARKAGNLDLITAIQVEKKAIEELKAESTADWSKAKGLAAAQKAYNDTVAKAKKGYLQKLEEVIKKLVQAKRDEEAKLVKAYVENLRLEEIKRVFCGEWLLSNEKGKIGKIIYKADLTFATENGKDGGTWTYKDNKIVCKWKDGNENVLTLSNDKFAGTTSNGGKLQGTRIDQGQNK